MKLLGTLKKQLTYKGDCKNEGNYISLQLKEKKKQK